MNYNQIEVSAIKDYSHTAQLALCIEHIGAAMTALRVNNRVKSMPQFYQDYHNYSILCYAAHIGGTLEDRMADMVLGLVVFAKQNKIHLDVLGYVHYGTPTEYLMRACTFVCYINNLSNSQHEYKEDILENWKQINVYICSALSNIEMMRRELKIDLSEHIRLKQEWLKTREYE